MKEYIGQSDGKDLLMNVACSSSPTFYLTLESKKYEGISSAVNST